MCPHLCIFFCVRCQVDTNTSCSLPSLCSMCLWPPAHQMSLMLLPLQRLMCGALVVQCWRYSSATVDHTHRSRYVCMYTHKSIHCLWWMPQDMSKRLHSMMWHLPACVATSWGVINRQWSCHWFHCRCHSSTFGTREGTPGRGRERGQGRNSRYAGIHLSMHGSCCHGNIHVSGAPYNVHWWTESCASMHSSVVRSVIVWSEC